MEELSRWCGRCGTELRAGARFCSRCGQRVIGEEPAASGGGFEAGAGAAPLERDRGERSGPGFTEVGSPRPLAPASGPASGGPASATPPGPGVNALFGAPPAVDEQAQAPAAAPVAPVAPVMPVAPVTPSRDDWSDWYADTSPRSPFQAPAHQAYQQPGYEAGGYQQPGYEAGGYQPAGYSPPGTGPDAYARPASQQGAAPGPMPGPSPFFPPSGGPGGPGGPSGPGGPGRPPQRDRRSRAPLFWSALSALVVAAVVAILFVFHPFSHHETVNSTANSTAAHSTAANTATASAASASTAASPSASSPGASPSPTVSASASVPATASASAPASASNSPAAVTEQQAATNVARMLAGSVADRSAIDNAYADVMRCGPNLSSDAGVFTSAAASRQQLLGSLGSMPGRAALPPALLSNLASAWQASIAADQSFATWADDEAAHCVANDTNSAAYQATVAPDNEATHYKTAFVDQWNPIANSYGLATYSQQQL